MHIRPNTWEHPGRAQQLNFTTTMGVNYPKPVPFPRGTRGFLYYLIPHTNSPTLLNGMPTANEQYTSDTSPHTGAGQLRFRITRRRDPASFASGKDLALPNGSPWNTVPRINAASSAVKRQLLNDGFITPADAAHAPRHRRTRTPTLTRLEDPFVIDFAATRVNLNIQNLRGGNPLKLGIWDRFKYTSSKTKSYYNGNLSSILSTIRLRSILCRACNIRSFAFTK